MAVREGRVFISTADEPAFGSNYYVQALEVGGQVQSGSGTSWVMRSNHGLATDDKIIVGTDVSTYRTCTLVSGDNVTLNSSVTSAVGDMWVNLGQDTGGTEPEFDGNGLAIYTDMEYSNQANNNTVQADENGRYRYWHNGLDIWELVRNGTTPIAIIVSAAQSATAGPGSSTDNAVALWDGTGGGTLKNSVVIVSSGAVSGITTLATSGAITGGAGLALTGAITGATAITASGLITGTLGITITGATASFAATTVSSTLAVTGATTLTGGVTGNVAASGNLSGTDVTSGGNVYSSVATVTASTTQTQGQQALTKDVNNVSVVANTNDTVTLPAASAGRTCTVINNGANTLRIYPASGDNLGTGVDTLTTLTSGSNRRYVAIDSTNWETV